jgi:serine/threonine protein kinase
MALQLTSRADFAHVSEFDSETNEFQYTMLAAVDDAVDVIYYVELPIRKAEISFHEVAAKLEPIPDGEIFPLWPLADDSGAKQLFLAPSVLPTNLQVFIKRPNLRLYDVFSRNNVVHLAEGLLEEARTMEFLSNHPHPNIIRYHGCRSRDGYLTGIVLDRYSYDLQGYMKKNVEAIDKEKFMRALESAVHHLHSLGWAHNDLNPTNIMVDYSDEGDTVPILIDFGSAREIGSLLRTSRGTAGWFEGRIEDVRSISIFNFCSTLLWNKSLREPYVPAVDGKLRTALE